MTGASKGWRTELLILIAIVLGLAFLADIAGQWDLTSTGETATLVGGLVAQVLAVVTAKARQTKVKDLEAVAGGKAGV